MMNSSNWSGSCAPSLRHMEPGPWGARKVLLHAFVPTYNRQIVLGIRAPNPFFMEFKAESPNTSVRGLLLRLDGPLNGTQYSINSGVTRVGRSRDCDLSIEGAESAVVSAAHLEIRRAGDTFILVDLDSTNGTYVDGQRVHEVSLQNHARIRLGPAGPEFQFETSAAQDSEGLDQTMRVAAVPAELPTEPAGQVAVVVTPEAGNTQRDELLREAVRRARQARHGGVAGQTSMIMREMLDKALHHSSRRFKFTIAALTVALLSVSIFSLWTINRLRKEKDQIDSAINQIEAQLASAGGDTERVDSLLEKLNRYQQRALEAQKGLLYRLGVRNKEQDFVDAEIKALLKEFGAEEYSVPKEFSEQVRRFIEQYQGRDRSNMERALGRSRKDLDAVRKQLRKDNLPPDLAYMVLVESAFIQGSTSPAGAAGLWQFTPSTARAYGLVVSDSIDERLDARKSTQAAARYIRELILDFGSGSSVMLALAAYNLGPGNVKRAVRAVNDPIKQRSFWYLYRIKALPIETREYIPKMIAAIIVGRNPAKFGFSS